MTGFKGWLDFTSHLSDKWLPFKKLPVVEKGAIAKMMSGYDHAVQYTYPCNSHALYISSTNITIVYFQYRLKVILLKLKWLSLLVIKKFFKRGFLCFNA